MRKYTPEERILLKKHSDTLKTLRKLAKDCKTTYGLKIFQSSVKDACSMGFPIDFTLQNSKDTLLNTVMDLSCYVPIDYRCNAVEIILEQGADPNHQNNYGETPLTQCANNQFVTCFTPLLKYGADPNICNAKGENVLMILAAWGYDYDIFSKILSQTEDINHKSEDGRTVLGRLCSKYISANFYKTRNFIKRAIQAVLAAGADPDIDTSWENYLSENIDWGRDYYEQKTTQFQELSNYLKSYCQKKEELTDSTGSTFDYEL
ncbi:ankyrin repeat domain-containing protein [uncultured Cloacibacillus sp.]|uniref:ankyrin repeat domain-containing protein n=1 Tax=uncultured Cloacibacillus sp. TaxID=889794 RepID=UPI0026DC012D|nr:ankyrin repeat domain-containing protein [uncultured Cloacibacillus sp.]